MNNQAQQITDADKKIGHELCRIRVQLGYSKAGMAQVINITAQQLDKYEKGINRLPFSRFLEICVKFGVNTLDFIGRIYPALGGKNDR